MEPMDLTRNGISLDGDVLFALDGDGAYRRLIESFPNREYYVFEHEAASGGGSLHRIVRN
jgi:hypothetical protein